MKFHVKMKSLQVNKRLKAELIPPSFLLMKKVLAGRQRAEFRKVLRLINEAIKHL